MADSEADHPDAKKKKHDAFDRVSLAVTIIGVVVLCVYTGLTYWQARLTRGALNIANQQLAVAKDTEQRQLRAYVSVKPDKDVFEVGQETKVNVLIEGFGLTPAYDVQVTIASGLTPVPLPSNDVLKKVGSDIAFKGKASLFPGEKFVVPYINHVVPDQTIYQAVKRGVLTRLYVYGTVTYKDAFGCRRVTNYCSGIGGNDLEATECEDRNEHDDPAICTK